MTPLWETLSATLWILGLAVLLATWSRATYEAHVTHHSVWRKLETSGYALAMNAGMVLLLAGLAATDRRLWAQITLALLAIAVAVTGALRFRKSQDRHVNE